MKKLTKILFLILLLSAIRYPLNAAYAAIPHLINYQGRLTDSVGNPLNGAYNLNFKIYDAETAGNLLWEETHSGVVIQKGIFSILLGSVTDLNLPFDKQYYLEIKVNNEVMSPRQEITSAGYAIRAERAEETDKAGYSEKIKTDSADTSPGYLVDKVDSSTIKFNTSTHKLYVPHGFQLFTTNGTFTAPMGVDRIYLTMIGGGGGGGGANNNDGWGGGGAGECLINYPYSVTPGNNYTVTIGSGGVGGSPENSGAPGGSTSFDSLSVAGGGSGSWHNGGIGGQVDGNGSTAGKMSIKTGDGATVGWGVGGGGGGGPFGAGGNGGFYPQNATGYGAGGGGSTGNLGINGGNGSPGLCIVEW